MSKRDKLMGFSGNIDESMGAGRALPNVAPASQVADHVAAQKRLKDACTLPIELIGPDPNQPRKEFEKEALSHLAQSIKEKGQLQPIHVRWDQDRAQYTVVVGERRWRASQMAGVERIACIVHMGEMDPGELMGLQLAENCVRKDLKPIEEAMGFKALMEYNKWSAKRVAEDLAIEPSRVVRALKLLELPEEIRNSIADGTLPASSGYELSKVAPEAAEEIAREARFGGLTRDQVADRVKRVRADPGTDTSPSPRRRSRSWSWTEDGISVKVSGASGKDAVTKALRMALKAAAEG